MCHTTVADHTDERIDEEELPPLARTRWHRHHRHAPLTEGYRWQRHSRHQSPGTLTADTETGQSIQDHDD